MSDFESGSSDDYWKDGRVDPPEADESNVVVEYVDEGEAIQVRDDDPVTEAWIRSDTTGEDYLYQEGQLENGWEE